MSVRIIRCNLLPVAGLFLLMKLTCISADQQTAGKDQWQFNGTGGKVTISVVGSKAAPSLEFDYDEGARPSLAEETEFLRQALDRLSTSGMYPSRMRGIQMRGFAEQEILHRLAVACIQSAAWQSRRSLPGGSEGVIKKVLNSIGAYNAFNPILRQYGLQVRVAGVEKVSSVKCTNLGLADIPCEVYHNPALPSGANVFIALDKID